MLKYLGMEVSGATEAQAVVAVGETGTVIAMGGTWWELGRGMEKMI
jgi:hypothetical protein